MNVSDDGTPETRLSEDVRKTDPVLRAKRAIAIVAVFFLVQLFTCIAVVIGKVLYVVAFQGTADKSILTNAITRAILPASIASEIAAALAAFWMTKRFFTRTTDSGGLASVGWRAAGSFETVGAALAGCLVSLIYIFVFVRISPPIPGQHWGPLATATLAGGWSRHFWALLALAFAPPIEEFVFRGILLEGLSNSIGIKAAAGIVTVAFVLLHASETLAYWPAWAGISLLASATLFFRLKTRSLVPAIGAHVGYNLVMVVAMYTGSA